MEWGSLTVFATSPATEAQRQARSHLAEDVVVDLAGVVVLLVVEGAFEVVLGAAKVVVLDFVVVLGAVRLFFAALTVTV